MEEGAGGGTRGSHGSGLVLWLQRTSPGPLVTLDWGLQGKGTTLATSMKLFQNKKEMRKGKIREMVSTVRDSDAKAGFFPHPPGSSGTVSPP